MQGCYNNTPSPAFLETRESGSVINLRELVDDDTIVVLRDALTSGEMKEYTGENAQALVALLAAVKIVKPIEPLPTEAPGSLWEIRTKGDDGFTLYLEDVTSISIHTQEGDFFYTISPEDGEKLHEALTDFMTNTQP